MGRLPAYTDGTDFTARTRKRRGAARTDGPRQKDTRAKHAAWGPTRRDTCDAFHPCLQQSHAACTPICAAQMARHRCFREATPACVGPQTGHPSTALLLPLLRKRARMHAHFCQRPGRLWLLVHWTKPHLPIRTVGLDHHATAEAAAHGDPARFQSIETAYGFDVGSSAYGCAAQAAILGVLRRFHRGGMPRSWSVCRGVVRHDHLDAAQWLRTQSQSF